MCDPGGESQRPPQGASTERAPRRGMATHREGMHIGPNGGWVIVFLRQTYSSSMTPANNCPPSMYVWKGGNSFLGGRGGYYQEWVPYPLRRAHQGAPTPPHPPARGGGAGGGVGGVAGASSGGGGSGGGGVLVVSAVFDFA